MNPANDPSLKSFVDVDPNSDFPIQNLPFGVFRSPAVGVQASIGVAIGNQILDLTVLEASNFFDGPILNSNKVFSTGCLNDLLALGRPAWTEARNRISELLRDDNPTLRDNEELRQQALVAQSKVEMRLPAEIGDYTDFYSSKEHATNVGSMLRGEDNALMPNWVHLPVAYHGRASSVTVSGTDVRRPAGQRKPPDADAPIFGLSKSFDFELEMGYFIGPGNSLGDPIPIGQANEHLFGMVLVNDWSARDIQGWEYQPLGPFLSKSVGTSISPWVVTLDALEPFRTEGPKQDPTPLPYLQQSGPMSYNIELEVLLQSETMSEPERICLSNFRHLYWSPAQHVAHHTVNGCNLRPGDLLATGTISGSDPGSYGSMLELAWRGSKPISLSNGETRAFLQDNDRVTLRGWCQGDGYRVGFGEVTSKVLPGRAVE